MSTFEATGEPGSLKALCTVSKQACDILKPMITTFYNALNGETSKLKSDNSVFTIADGTVQHLLINHLYADKFKGIVGEEECEVDLVNRPFTVDGLTVPEEFCDMIESVRDQIKDLSNSIVDANGLYKTMSIFIDPIDGTREFSTNKGEQSSVCIGFSDKAGLPVAGVVYRPITEPATWAAGAKAEAYADGVLDMVEGEPINGLLASNGGVSPFLVALMEEGGMTKVPSGGAGNKMLMVLEGKGSAYIQDRGVSRWDTCGAQACIEAYGGVMAKLSTFASSPELKSYTYLKGETNLDFVAGESNMTPYNVNDKALCKKGDPVTAFSNVSQVKPYSNVCGLVAMGAINSTPEKIQEMFENVQRAKAKSAPSFD